MLLFVAIQNLGKVTLLIILHNTGHLIARLWQAEIVSAEKLCPDSISLKLMYFHRAGYVDLADDSKNPKTEMSKGFLVGATFYVLQFTQLILQLKDYPDGLPTRVLHNISIILEREIYKLYRHYYHYY